MNFVKYDNKYILRIDKGQEIVKTLTEFCEKNNIKNGSIMGIGATNDLTIGLFDTNEKEYHSKRIEKPMEITSLLGNISTKNNEVYLHLHINVADKDLNVYGGHLNECYVSATCEIIIDKINGFAKRTYNDEIGLNLYDFSI